MLIVVEDLVFLDRLYDVLALLDKEMVIFFQVASERCHLLPEVQEFLLRRFNLKHKGLNSVSSLLEEVVQTFHLGDPLRLLVRNLTRECIPDVVFALSAIEDDFKGLDTLRELVMVNLKFGRMDALLGHSLDQRFNHSDHFLLCFDFPDRGLDLETNLSWDRV